MIRILFDMQGIQAGAKIELAYATALIKSLTSGSEKIDVFLILSDRFPESILSIRDSFSLYIPRDRILVCSYPHLNKNENELGFVDYSVFECLREAFLLQLNPNLVLLTYPIEKSLEEKIVFSPSERLNQIPLQALAGKFPETIDFDQAEFDGLKKGLPQSQLKKITEYMVDLALTSSLNTEIFLVGKEQELPRLAYVSPLPPLRSGIADYSADLVPHLAKYYQIDIITDQLDVSEWWLPENCKIKNCEWFLENSDQYDRVLYHFGNNPMHVSMPEMLNRIPGMVVLHDFFLSGLQWYREKHCLINGSFLESLYRSHGYTALFLLEKGDEFLTLNYPCNYDVLSAASGIVVHSESSTTLCEDWYRNDEKISTIPLLRAPPSRTEKSEARKKLGFHEDDFIVCSFGFLGKTKLNQRLLDAWKLSALLNEGKSCKLVFVGEMDGSIYCAEMAEEIDRNKKSKNISITGWTTQEDFRLYLSAADVGVQLRTLSRGETSAAVLDCLNYGLATIVNANGAMVDIPDDVVIKISDNFEDDELVKALESLRLSTSFTRDLQLRATRYMELEHSPSLCAQKYFEVIEKSHALSGGSWRNLAKKISLIYESSPQPNITDIALVAKAISQNHIDVFRLKRIFFDISVVVNDDFKTGIQRVVRSLLLEMIKSPPNGFLIEPVYLSESDDGTWHYRYARKYTLSVLNCNSWWTQDDVIESCPGDIFTGVDLAGSYVIRANTQGVYDSLRKNGVFTSFVVYDLIPIEFESTYPPGFKEGHEEWLKVVCQADLAICISQSVACQLHDWIDINGIETNKNLKIDWFHLGADVAASAPSKGVPDNAKTVLKQISGEKSFLMVGTIEPRKGHLQTIKAFEILWESGKNFNLVIVGKRGWLVDELVRYIEVHSELNKRLLWLESISDEYLEKVYEVSTCLIAASEGEGFGLPLIEAAKHGLPVIARDIPVFREVGGAHIDYFSGKEASDISREIILWCQNYGYGKQKATKNLPYQTWEESSKRFSEILISTSTTV